MVLRRWSLILTACQVTNEFKQWSSVQQTFYNSRPVVALWPPVAAGRECGLRGGMVSSRATQEGESVGLYCSLSPPEEANEEQDTHQGGTPLPAESLPKPGLSTTGKLQVHENFDWILYQQVMRWLIFLDLRLA